MTGSDVIKNAIKYLSYVYWYGAKGEKCSEKLLERLSTLYPGIYNLVYIRKCREDIAAGKYAIDCSGLVCNAYGIPQISTYQMPDIFSIAKGTPLNGMIVWNTNHVGIYNNGYVIEARGIDYDVTTTRRYRKEDWAKVMYMPGVEYDTKVVRTSIEYLRMAVDVAIGKYGNGESRRKAVTNMGYNYDKLQNIINDAYKEVSNDI